MISIEQLESQEEAKAGLPEFRSGDVVRVHTKVREGARERIQVFEGMIVQRKNGGPRATFTVRKVSFGIGVERVFPVRSPKIERIEVVKTGKVRKSRLFYMRDRSGRKARLRERDLPGSESTLQEGDFLVARREVSPLDSSAPILQASSAPSVARASSAPSVSES